MEAPELEVTISLVAVVELVDVGDLGQEWSGILGQRVEEDSVNDQADCLSHLISFVYLHHAQN